MHKTMNMFFLIRKHDNSNKLCIKEVRPDEVYTFRNKNAERILDEDLSDIEAIRKRGEFLQLQFAGEFDELIELDVLEEE